MVKFPAPGKQKPNFATGSTITKVKIEHSKKGNQKVLQKRFHAYYCLDGHSGIDDWNFLLFEQWEIHEPLKERGTFGNTDLKPFTQ